MSDNKFVQFLSPTSTVLITTARSMVTQESLQPRSLTLIRIITYQGLYYTTILSSVA